MGSNVCKQLGVKDGTTMSTELVDQLWAKYSKNDEMSEAKVRSFFGDLTQACEIKMSDVTYDHILQKCAVTPLDRHTPKKFYSLREFKKLIGFSTIKVPIDLSQSLKLQLEDIKSEDQLVFEEYCTETRKVLWEEQEKKTLEERRQRYKCAREKVTKVEDIESWADYAAAELRFSVWRSKKNPIPNDLHVLKHGYVSDPSINKKVALWRGDITKLEIDAIQNAAKESLLGGGGIDGAIHSAAGDELVEECELMGGCETGDTKTSRGYRLPAKYVLHTVGPIGEKPDLLRSCYLTTLNQAKQFNIRTIALCGVSTGIFGYPLEKACPVALQTVREWLSDPSNASAVDKIVFTVFLEKELECYSAFMPAIFPLGFTHQEIASTMPPWALNPLTGKPLSQPSA